MPTKGKWPVTKAKAKMTGCHRTEKQIIKALRKEGGLIARAAKVLGYADTFGLYKYIKGNPHIQKVVADIREENLDMVESSLMTKITGREGKIVYHKDNNGNFIFDRAGKPIVKKNIKEIAPDLGAICFYLKCLGRERGYIEKLEVSGKNGEPIRTEKYIHHRIEKVNFNVDAKLGELDKKGQEIKNRLSELKQLKENNDYIDTASEVIVKRKRIKLKEKG